MPLKPERNSLGAVVPHDDPALDRESFLVRNINPEWHVVFDENIQAKRLKSAAFSRTNGDPAWGMSVDLGQLLVEKGLPEHHMVPDGMGAVRIKVGDLRAEGLSVGSDPEPTDEFHGQVWGVKDNKRAKVQALASGWVVPLDGVRIR